MKAKTINKFIGKDYIVKASVGHVRDLPKSELGVDEETFEPGVRVSPVRAGSRLPDADWVGDDKHRLKRATYVNRCPPARMKRRRSISCPDSAPPVTILSHTVTASAPVAPIEQDRDHLAYLDSLTWRSGPLRKMGYFKIGQPRRM